MSSSNYYKDQYNDLKQDLKRKNRELDDLEDRCRRCESETKKAKIESQEILKLYHGLQHELQLAYERNAKLQVDKASFEGLLDSERKDFDIYKRQQSTTNDEGKKLKDALCAMRIEKLELETKFNTIVMENKDLRDRARQYEPRLRELDELKKKINQIEQYVQDQLKPELQTQTESAQRAQVRQEQIDRYVKWNDLLKRECQEKSQQLKRYDELIEFARRLEDEKSVLQIEVDELKTKFEAGIPLTSNSPVDLSLVRLQLRQLRDLLSSLKIDFQNQVDVCTKDILVVLDHLKKSLAIPSHDEKVENAVVEIFSTNVVSQDDCADS